MCLGSVRTKLSTDTFFFLRGTDTLSGDSGPVLRGRSRDVVNEMSPWPSGLKLKNFYVNYLVYAFEM